MTSEELYKRRINNLIEIISRISDDIVNTYLSYLSKKYDININYKALERVKNSLR